MSEYYDVFTQCFPPEAEFTESSLGEQTGKVFAITGASSGIGYELARILYAAGGTVYALNRNETKSLAAIERIKKASKGPTEGSINYIECDLSDLETIPTAVAAFKDKTSRLDVLFLNAGVAGLAPTALTQQAYEPHIGVNCLGPFLLAKLLAPTLAASAKAAPPSTVRVIWTSSITVDRDSPAGGLAVAKLATPSPEPRTNYAISKVGNWFLASEFHKRHGKGAGVVSVSQNPGNLKSDLWRNSTWLTYLTRRPVCYQPVFGAYTSLWAAFAEEVSVKNGGRYIIPWGRWHPGLRADIAAGVRGKDQGGSGAAAEFWEWCEKQTDKYQQQ